jgi:hypothetical protein
MLVPSPRRLVSDLSSEFHEAGYVRVARYTHVTPFCILAQEPFL